MKKLNLTKPHKTDHKCFSIFLVIISIAILSFLNTQISFSQEPEDCDNDNDCQKASEPCCGEDLCEVYGASALLVSTTNNVQMRDLNGVYFEKLSPSAGEQYSFMSSTPEGSILFSGFSSGNVSTYDDLTKESGIMRSGYILPKSIVYDNYWNMYLLNSGKNEILKIDPKGSPLSSFHLKGSANSIAMLPDQCSMLISYNDGSIDKLDLCSERSGTSAFSSGILKKRIHTGRS